MVYRLLTSGELECYRFGTAYRVSEEQLKQFLEKQKAVNEKVLPKGRKFF
jgi:hypothetical protein